MLSITLAVVYTCTGASKRPDDTPGPADFDPKLQKPSAPAYTIGARTKQPALADKENSCIGPEYEVPEPSRRPAYTMGAKPAMPVLEPMPGPGQYDEMRYRSRALPVPIPFVRPPPPQSYAAVHRTWCQPHKAVCRACDHAVMRRDFPHPSRQGSIDTQKEGQRCTGDQVEACQLCPAQHQHSCALIG